MSDTIKEDLEVLEEKPSEFILNAFLSYTTASSQVKKEIKAFASVFERSIRKDERKRYRKLEGRAQTAVDSMIEILEKKENDGKGAEDQVRPES